MSRLSYIDREGSIAVGKLLMNRSRLDKIDHIADKVIWSALFLGLILYPTIVYFHISISNSNDRAVAFVVFPFIILVGVYGLYRKLTENNLIVIETSWLKQKNKEYLLEFATKSGYEVIEEGTDILILNVEESLSYDKVWTKTITFIINDGRIYFNIVKRYPKSNPPVFFTHLILKADLTKYFNNK